MSIQIKCAWCGVLLGIKEGEVETGLTVSHTICPRCAERMSGVVSLWDGVERRMSDDRRKGERRMSMRSSVYTLVVIDGITWIDNIGSDRRHNLRRLSDRERIASRIISGKFN
ncbi:MAG TPA: hypothetical protein VKA70_22260 [Blastocatellia bacterium]|nr:hypothetical protein [Blastocatellia bacterium]